MVKCKCIYHVNAASAAVVQRPDGGSLLLHCPKNQRKQREVVKCLLQVHEAHVDWTGKLPGPLQWSCEGKELLHCSS